MFQLLTTTLSLSLASFGAIEAQPAEANTAPTVEQIVIDSESGPSSTRTTFEFDSAISEPEALDLLISEINLVEVEHFKSSDLEQLTSPDGTLHIDVPDSSPIEAQKILTQVLVCDRFYDWTDAGGTFTLQRACNQTQAPWSFRLNPAVQATIVGNVSEVGMIWHLSGVPQGQQAPHINVPPSYIFHGTFNPVGSRQIVEYVNEISGRHGGGGGDIAVEFSGRWAYTVDS